MRIRNLIKWILAQTAIVTMALMPVTQGLAAERQQQEISKAMVQNALIEMGLNKSITYGEFYKKNKDKYPERIQKKLAPYFAKFSSTPMPQFDVGTAKGSDGDIHPVLRASQNGQLHNVQFFGETEKYAKFDNTNLTEIDLINFDDMLIRLSAGDMKKNQQLQTVEPAADFSKSPDFNKELWMKMNPQQRAGYVLSMRLLYNDAHGVLLAYKNKKKSPKNKKTKDFSFLDLFMINEAQALPNKSADTTDTSKSCLVAGYVTEYRGRVCSYSQIKAEYKDESKLAGAAFKSCDPKVACNPLVFGTPNGVVRCIAKSDPRLQIATHYNGPCEDANHTNTEIKFLKNPNDKTGRYAETNLTKNAAQIQEEALKEQQPNFKSTEDFINGILKYKAQKGQVAADLVDLFTSKKPNEALLAEILNIKKNFDSEIKQATEACKDASRTNGYHEKNFWGACDQLQRRFLFVKEYLQQNMPCAKDTVMNDSFKCTCPEGSAEKEVLPGASCTKTPTTTPTPTPSPSPGPSPTATPAGPVGGECDLPCKLGETCQFVPNKDNPTYTDKACVGKPTTSTTKKKGSSFFSKALPWLAVGGVVAAMYFLWKPKKPKLNGAGDLCPNGLVAPCGVPCAAPKVYVAGSGCSCAACPPGQTTVNLNTCECGTSNPTQLVCADGITIVTDLSQCPPATYTCWDGSVVTNPINCPERPPAAGTSGKTNK